jgi:hypothetical protein
VFHTNWEIHRAVTSAYKIESPCSELQAGISTVASRERPTSRSRDDANWPGRHGDGGGRVLGRPQQRASCVYRQRQWLVSKRLQLSPRRVHGVARRPRVTVPLPPLPQQ